MPTAIIDRVLLDGGLDHLPRNRLTRRDPSAARASARYIAATELKPYFEQAVQGIIFLNDEYVRGRFKQLLRNNPIYPPTYPPLPTPPNAKD